MAANKQRSSSGGAQRRSSAGRADDLGRFKGGTLHTSFNNGSCFFAGRDDPLAGDSSGGCVVHAVMAFRGAAV